MAIVNYIHDRISHIFEKNIRGKFFKTCKYLIFSENCVAMVHKVERCTGNYRLIL